MSYSDIVGADMYLGAEDIVGAQDLIGADVAFGADADMAALMSGAEPELAAFMAGSDADMAWTSGAVQPPPQPPRPGPMMYPQNRNQYMPPNPYAGRPPMAPPPPMPMAPQGYAPQGHYPQPYPYPYPYPVPQSPSNRQAFMANLAARNSVAVVERRPMKARNYPLGFPETIIPAGATVPVSQRPQVPFRGQRLFIPSDISGYLVIMDIRVGKNSQLVASGPLPARMFSEVGVDSNLTLDTAQVSQDITLILRNISGAPVTFFGSLTGKAIE